MKFFQKIILVLFLIASLTGCWAARCPMKSCHVKFEHVHEGQKFRGGSFITARKHWIWERWGKKKKYDGKTDKKGKTKFKNVLPEERVNFDKPPKQ